MYDVYAYGVISASTLVELEGAFPEEAGYAEIVRLERSLGGEAAGSAFVLGRLGMTAKLAGSELGTDDASGWVVERLSDAGVDCSRVAMIPGGGVTEIVVTSGRDRTILATYGRMLRERAWSAPRREDVRSSRVVCLDPFFDDESELVAEWCSEDDIPYVTIDVHPESPIAAAAAILIVSAEYSRRTFGDVEPESLLGAYAEACSGLVVHTTGDGPVWYRRSDTELRALPAFDVDARDTAGAGDAFRAGATLALLQGGDDAQIVRTASAVAAMVCQTSPGVLHSPTAAELEAFFAAH